MTYEQKSPTSFFDITIHTSRGGGYPITVNGSGGDASGMFFLPLGQAELEYQLGEVQSALASNRPAARGDKSIAQDFGRLLFDSLFEGPILQVYRRNQAYQTQGNQTIRLNIEPPELDALPWELLYDRQTESFLALSRASALVRYVPARQAPAPPLGLTPPLHMLVALASPSGLPPIDLDRGLDQLQLAVSDLARGGLLEMSIVRGPDTLRAFRRALRTQPAHLLHFIGHTWNDQKKDDSGLVFEDSDGDAINVEASVLAMLIDQPTLRMIYLDTPGGQLLPSSSAGGMVASALLRRGVAAVVSGQRPATDDRHIDFVRTFYEALAEGQPVNLAITEARKTFTFLSRSAAWSAPTLYTNLTDLRLFTIVAPLPTIPNRQSEEEQRRAAEAARDAQVEQDARRLEQVESVDVIAQVARALGASELDTPASSVLRSFARIGQDVGAALQQGSSYNQRTALTVIEDRLDVLYRELAGSTLPYAGRFHPIAARWRALIGDHVRALADEVEQLQEIDSPYIAGPPLTEQQDTFTGRTNASQRIEQLVRDRRSPPLLLYGQRRMGKTSLLRNLGRLLPSTIVPMFVDLQGPPANASDHAGLLFNLSRAMADSALRYRQISLLSLTREVLAPDPFTIFDQWLEDVERVLGRHAASGRTALLMLDEFEALEKPFSDGRFDAVQVLGMLRNLIQHRPRFRVLLAGTHTLGEYTRWASYLINVQIVHLSYLGEQETRDLIEQPMTDFALRYEPAAVDRIIALTRGHPYLAQLLCSEIVALKNQQDVSVRRLARLSDVELAVPSALDSGTMFFADMETNQIDAAGRALLARLATAGEGQAVPLGTLAAALPDPAAAEQVAEKLRRRELIELFGSGLRFQVELIRRWFARPH